MRFVLVNNVDSCCDGYYGALVTSSRYGHCWSMTFDNAKIMQTERRASSLLECYAVVQLILCKDTKYEMAA